MKNSTLIKTSLFVLGMASTASMAANQGSLGATSTGDLTITLDIDDLVRVNNLDDIDLGNFTGGTGDLTGSDDFCIYRNGPGTYEITMTGDGAGSAFALASAGNTLAYTVDFNATAVTATTPLTGQTGANTTDDTCGGGTGGNVSVDITVSNAALVAAPAGAYSGVLTMVVTPE